MSLWSSKAEFCRGALTTVQEMLLLQVGIQRQHRTLPSKTFSPKSLRGLLEAPRYREMHSVTTELDANITDEVPSQPLGW